MKNFGVMLDMSRNAVMKPSEIKKYVTLLKSFGYNMVQLYTEDTYEVENEPYFGYMRGRYTTEELKDIVNYCNSIGMEIIPCIQTLAHLNQIFRWQEYSTINDTADILLIEDDRTYELIENMFKSLRKSFTSEYVHIGMDEAHMLGLGKYLDKHGYQNRFEALSKHLKKVIEIAKKYGFKPIMWSDMFFRLANNGEYYPAEPSVSQEVVDITPKDVGLVYWDYYHIDKETYDKMFDAHKMFKNEVWFAGGAWTWTGFAPGNAFTLETMIPAMQSAKEHGIENIILTLWGDDGKECSFYSVLPSLFAIRKIYDGETDMDRIKTEFAEITGENYDEMSALDCPNYVGENVRCMGNVSKHMLFSDPFLGFLDSTVKDDVSGEFVHNKDLLLTYAKNSKSFSYLFEAEAALCDVMAIKYDLGVRTREAYARNDKKLLKEVIKNYQLAIEKIEVFHGKFSTLWHKENKPHGFDVQDIRIGGLVQRLKSCKKRLENYLEGTLKEIPELDEELLDYFGGNIDENRKLTPCLNNWKINSSVNVI